MDNARRITILRKQIEEANGGRPEDFNTWKQRTHATMRAAMGADHPFVKELESVRYSLMMWTESTPSSAWAEAQASGVRSAVAILQGAIHEVEVGMPSTPSESVSAMHPWVADSVARLWDDGHYRQAVDEATHVIELRLKAKVDSYQTGASLVTEAFNPKPPTRAQKRLRFPRFKEGTPSWTSAHEGAMYFGRGCMLRIRNLVEHEDDALDRQVAAECLAALSLLARWIDEATVIEL